jgi:hypothetical protein
MVRSDQLSRLRQLFDDVKRKRLNIHSYSGKLFDVIFDILTAESAVAGIATRLIEGQAVPTKHTANLQKPFMIGDDWLLDGGERIDLAGSPDIHIYAVTLERLREACYAATMGL